MKLATLDNRTADGRLVVVSSDGAKYLAAGDAVSTLQSALEQWSEVAPGLMALAEQLIQGHGKPLTREQLCAPLPRAWQWLDGSAFASHGNLMAIAFGIDPIPADRPLMYQGLSDKFYGPFDDIPMTDEALGIDFEGEFGIITDHVPMGIQPADALRHIKLIVQINDWSLRTLAPVEMRTGFGWIQAKPPCSMAGFAITPDELGESWQDGRVCLNLTVDWNGKRFGCANGAEMTFGFHQLIAHAARTRALPAGTVIGSGTVSNNDYRRVGSSCIAERRAIELIDGGAPQTSFMAFGDTVRMDASDPTGASIFGPIDQKIVKV